MRRLDSDEKVGYRWEGGYRWESWIQMRRLDSDEKIRYRWEGLKQMRRLDTDEKVGYRWEGCIQMRMLHTDEKVGYKLDWKGLIKVYFISQCPKVKTGYRYKTRSGKQSYMHAIFVYIYIFVNKFFFFKFPLLTFILYYQNSNLQKY